MRKWGLAIVLLLFGAGLVPVALGDDGGRVAVGVVFHDENRNGIRDPGEEGIPGVPVSDGMTVVATGPDGSYHLPLGEESEIVFVTIPSGWWTEAFWRRLDSAMAADFALYRIPAPESFAFVQVTDIHIRPEVAGAVREFVARVNSLDPQPAFVVATGDIVSNVCTKAFATLEKVEEAFLLYREAMAGLAVPLLNVIGDNDCACGLPPDSSWYYKGAYQALFGPLWYSFDYGGWHFVVLDGNSCKPPPWDSLSEEELAWLEQDLAFQPQGRPIVLFSHEPLFMCQNYRRLLSILKGRNVKAALAGHWHVTWEKEIGILNIITGALSGRWWRDDGVHWHGSNIDRSPQGYRIFLVDGDDFSTEYVPMTTGD